jgi:membrane associated rhomboid family serine protease
MFIPIGTEEYTPRQRFPVVTLTLVAINSLVFIFELYLLYTGGQQALDAFITVFGGQACRAHQRGEPGDPLLPDAVQ